MIKRTQNHVAESRFTLPVVVLYAIAVWLASGLLIPSVPITSEGLWKGAWVQFVCFFVSAYVMVELNNSNALIRIYSRTVSCSFIVLLCAGCFLFGSMGGAITQLCVVASNALAFRSYQDKQSMGWIYYAFLCVGLASSVFVQVLFYVPFLWLMMFFQLTSLSWRTFFASILGLLTPYWFALPVLLYKGEPDVLVQHFVALADFVFPFDYAQLTVNELLLFVLVVVLGITGTIHYWRKQSSDSIRTRLFYSCFIQMWLLTVIFLVLQPQHYDMLIRILIINVSPLIAHFLSLTYTRITNIAFYVICSVAVLLMLFSLWMPSFSF